MSVIPDASRSTGEGMLPTSGIPGCPTPSSMTRMLVTYRHRGGAVDAPAKIPEVFEDDGQPFPFEEGGQGPALR
ncbi:hypothetical protein AB4Z10_22845 [Bosea sp. RAF48]|uniref:hypothetical protein n=1 Tax=Bosea sp. RAF48 TaxID=3237480 RepID=UPI003F8F39F2